MEAWRDAILSVTGSLDDRLGGVSEDVGSEKNRRRTLYGTVNRHELDAMLRLHDFPDPASHSPARAETSSPLQLLFTLNSPFALRQAEALAVRLEQEAGANTLARVNRAYALLYQRAPTKHEMGAASRFLAGRETNRAAWVEYAQALLGSNEMLFVD